MERGGKAQAEAEEVEAAGALLRRFERVIRSYRGRELAPASALPFSREEMQQTIELLRERRPSLHAAAALVELASFVPDDEAEADLAFDSYYRGNPRMPWREIRGPWRAVFETRKRVAAARSEAAWQIVDGPQGFAVAEEWRSDPSRLMTPAIGSAYDTLLHRRAQGMGISTTRWDGVAILALVAWSGIAGAVASILALWLLGKSLWWAIVGALSLWALPLAALLVGEALVIRLLRWPRLASLAETTSGLIAIVGWLPFAVLLAVLAPSS